MQKIKQSTTAKKRVSQFHTQTDTPLEKFDGNETITVSRQKQKHQRLLKKPDSARRKSIHDRNIYRVSQLRRELLAKDVTELRPNKLRKKEIFIFQRLNSILRADYDEEETFNLPCAQIYLKKSNRSRLAKMQNILTRESLSKL